MNTSDYPEVYSGGAFQGTRQLFGALAITSTGVRFDDMQGESATLPLTGLDIRAGGAGGKMIFLTHASRPDWTFYTTDPDILDNPLIREDEACSRQIREIRLAGRRSWSGLVIFALIVIGCIWGLFAVREPVIRAVASRIPASWEKSLGDTAFGQIPAGREVITDPCVTDAVKKITGPLLEKIPQDRYTFRVHVIRDPEINAFALPGGHIILHTGLLLAASGPEEIAGVVAHEAAHIVRQHSLCHVLSSVGIFALIQAFFGDASGIMAVLADSSSLLLNRKYSRDYEQEADDTGWIYMENAGIDPNGMIRFFERLQKEEDGDAFRRAGKKLVFLSTHPSTEDRIRRLGRKSEAARRDYPKMDVDIALMKQALEETGE